MEMKASVLSSGLLHPLSCFCMQTIMKKHPYIIQKIKKNLDKNFLVVTKGSVQEKGCGFSKKRKNDKNRTAMGKTCQNREVFGLFEMFTALYVLSHSTKV